MGHLPVNPGFSDEGSIDEWKIGLNILIIDTSTHVRNINDHVVSLGESEFGFLVIDIRDFNFTLHFVFPRDLAPISSLQNCKGS